MRRLPTILVLTAGLLGLAAISAAPAGGQSTEGGPCSDNQVEVRGIVRDAATGRRLPEIANVDLYPAGGGLSFDDAPTNPATSVFRFCAELGLDLKIRFDADNYRPEWWNNKPSRATANVIDIPDAPSSDPIIINAALTPNGRVIAGRVTNMNGVPKSASVGIWRRRPNGTWRSIDGEGNHLGNGWYEYRVPGYGRYRVSACVDNHWCQWSLSADRMSRSRVVNVVPSGPNFINNVHVRVPFCRRSPPDFCVPWGFLT